MIRAKAEEKERKREENERSESNTFFECGRASRKIDKIDKIARPRFDARGWIVNWFRRFIERSGFRNESGSSAGTPRNSVRERRERLVTYRWRILNAYDASWMEKRDWLLRSISLYSYKQCAIYPTRRYFARYLLYCTTFVNKLKIALSLL